MLADKCEADNTPIMSSSWKRFIWHLDAIIHEAPGTASLARRDLQVLRCD
jgi:hypothetical protein